MRKISFAVVLLLILVTCSMASALSLYDGKLNLAPGKYVESSEKKLSSNYPYVEFENSYPSRNNELAVSISKKVAFSWQLKARQQKVITNKTNVAYYYNEYGSGTYKGTYVNNNYDGQTDTIVGYYYMDSFQSKPNSLETIEK